MLRFLTLLILIASVPQTATATKLESHQRILRTAHAYLAERFGGDAESVKITPGKLDKRLRLKRCPQPLEGFAPGKRRSGIRQTVGVRCNGEPGWTLYVSASVEVSKPILVANRALSRGARIGRGDFRVETRVVSGLHRGYLSSADEVLGRRLKLSVRKDAALAPNQLRPRLDVTRGGRVTILGRAGSIEVRMAGKALADGSRGDRIKVTNSSSQREIEAVVIARDTVEVSL